MENLQVKVICEQKKCEYHSSNFQLWPTAGNSIILQPKLLCDQMTHISLNRSQKGHKVQILTFYYYNAGKGLKGRV